MNWTDPYDQEDVRTRGDSLIQHSLTASIILVFVLWVAYPICQAIFLFGGDLRIPYLQGKNRRQVEASLGEPYRTLVDADGGTEALHHLAHVSLRVHYDQDDRVTSVENPDLMN